MIFKKVNLVSISKNIKKTKKIDLIFKDHRGLMVQAINKKLRDTINLRYKKEESNSSPMEKSNHRNNHANTFLNTLYKEIKNKINNKKILDVGCGSGHILKLLKINGADVTGIEPGLKINKDKKISIVKDFSKLKKDTKFDIIVSNAVLEHIFNLKIFFKNLKKFLKKNGVIFFCVPDCEKSIKIGDPTILNHEHIYYFTKKSLFNIFTEYGFRAKVFNDDKGNLFCKAQTADTKFRFKKQKFSKNISINYKKKFNIFLNKFQNWIHTNLDNEIIFYGATAAIPTLLSYINLKGKLSKINVIDGDIFKQSQYISGLNKKILSPNYLKGINKDNIKIFIFAIHYEVAIKKILTEKFKINQKNVFYISRL